MSVDWFGVFELLLRGPSGWIPLVLGAGATAVATHFDARRRYKKARFNTHAYMGGEKGFKTLEKSDIDEMFACFEHFEGQLQDLLKQFRGTKGDDRTEVAGKIQRLAEQIIDKGDEILRANIAFRTQEGHRQFLDQIDGRQGQAMRLRRDVMRIQREGQQPRAKTASG